jgi:hypothetical protein
MRRIDFLNREVSIARISEAISGKNVARTPSNHDPGIVSFRDRLRRFAWQTDREESPRIYAQLSFLAY